jgi:DNA-binding CsgD family transcriptional regulator
MTHLSPVFSTPLRGGDRHVAHGFVSAMLDLSELLTARERDVLHWVAAGKTDRDIADILGISRRTVHKHLEHVYAKLGVETRTAAVMRALGLGAAPQQILVDRRDGWN